MIKNNTNNTTGHFNNLHQTKCNIKKSFDNYKYQNQKQLQIHNNHLNSNNKNIDLSTKMNSIQQNELNQSSSSIDLSGYLIFVTSNRNGSIKVYG